MDYSLLFAYWHYSICNLTIQYANLIESVYVLAFLVFSCYTITRYKTRKNQGLTRVSPIPGVKKMIDKTSTGFLSYPLRRVCS